MGAGKCFCQWDIAFQADVPEANCLPQGSGPPVRPAAKPAPKAAKPLDKPSTKSAANSAAKVAAKPAAKSAAGEPIPVAPVEHVQLFRVKNVTHRACLSVKLNMHPNRQFPGLFVVCMYSCLHVLLRVTCPLCSLGGGVTLGMSLHGYEDILPAGGCYSGGGGFPLSVHTPNLRDVTVASASDASKQCFGVIVNTVLNGVPLKQV